MAPEDSKGATKGLRVSKFHRPVSFKPNFLLSVEAACNNQTTRKCSSNIICFI